MGLPKQVIEAGQRSDDAIKAIQEQQGLDPDGGIITPAPDIEETAKPAGEVDENGKPIEAAKPDDDTQLDWEKEYKLLQEQNNTLKHQYSTLQGKYNAEIPRLQEEVRQLSAAKPSDTAAGTTTGSSESGADDIPADIEEMFGSEFVDFMKSRDKKAQDKIDTLTNKVEDLTKSDQSDKRNTFFDAIKGAHADWEQIDTTTAFLNFLKEELPDLGLTRQQVVDNAVNRGDPEPIIKQLTAFKDRAKPDTGKQRHVVPADGGGTALPVDTSTVRYNESTIQTFYREWAKPNGKFKGNTKEAERMERLYIDAVNDNRVNLGK